MSLVGVCSGWYMRLAQLVLQAPPAGVLKNGASCPYSVVICLVLYQCSNTQLWLSYKALNVWSLLWHLSVFCEVEAELSKLKLSDISMETGFDPRSVDVEFMVDKAALKPVSLRVFSCQYHPILIFFLITAFTRINEQSTGILNKQCCIGNKTTLDR